MSEPIPAIAGGAVTEANVKRDQTGTKRSRVLSALAAILLAGACDEPRDPGAGRSERARPVKVVVLAESDPSHEEELVGSVSAWHEEKIGFEVAGRVESVIDVGVEVRGLVKDEAVRIVFPGTEIARLDDTRHRRALESALADLEAVKARLAAQKVDLEEVAASEVGGAEAELEAARNDLAGAGEAAKSVEAQREFAASSLEREKSLLPSGGATQERFEEAEAQLASVEARLARAKAEIESAQRMVTVYQASVQKAKAGVEYRRASIAATEAEVAQYEVACARARRDVDDCVLRAPFNGRITRSFLVRGAHVNAGEPVATLTLLDPIQVSVAVSAAEDRRIRVGDVATLSVRGPGGSVDRLVAWVRDKSEVAHPGTHTFRIDLVGRNVRRAVDPEAAASTEAVLVEDVMPAVRERAGGHGPLHVFIQCLLPDGEGWAVLRVPASLPGETRARDRGVFVPEKIPVRLGGGHLGFLHSSFRELLEDGGLREGELLIVDPRPEHVERGARIEQIEWAIRPGDLVGVSLGAAPPAGFYVPAEAIVADGEETSVYLFEAGKARRVSVRIGATHRDLVRIEGEALRPDAEVVVRGVHYLEDGVDVVKVGVEASP